MLDECKTSEAHFLAIHITLFLYNEHVLTSALSAFSTLQNEGTYSVKTIYFYLSLFSALLEKVRIVLQHL